MALFGKKKKEEPAKSEEEAKDDAEKKEADKKEGDAKEGDGNEGGGEAGAEGEAPAEGGEAPAAPKSKKKLIIIAAAALVVLIGGGAGVFFSGILGPKEEKAAVILGPDGKPIEKPVYYTLPEFLINLNSGGKNVSFLKTTIIMEVSRQGDVPLIEANLPRVLDSFNTYLRELRPSDLSGSAGIQRLREELLLRANKAVAPAKINDVLFKDIVIQ